MLLYLGVSKIDAQSLFITEVYQIDGFGMQYFPVVINSEYAILGIGARYVAILDNELTIKKRYSTMYDIRLYCYSTLYIMGGV